MVCAAGGNTWYGNFFGYLLCVLPAGYLTRRYGPRRIILGGLLCATVGFSGLYVAHSFAGFVILMVLLGIGTAGIYTPVVTFIVGWFPQRRGFVLGMVNSGIGLGVFISGILLPWIAGGSRADGWRQAWLLFAVLSMVLLVMAYRIIRNPVQFSGAVAQNPPAAAKRDSFFSSEVYRYPSVRLIGLCYFILGFTYIVQAVFMYSYAIESGVSRTTAGQLSSVAGLLSIVAGFFWGTLSDVIGRSATLIICFTSGAIATLIPVFFPTPAGFAIHYLLAGSMISGLFATILAATSESVPPREVPLAIGFVTALFAVGQLLGPIVAGWIIGSSGSFGGAFIFSATTMLAGSVIAWQLSRLPVAGGQQ
jgi:MFS family permease